MRMAMQHVCQPLAHKLPKSEFLPASSSTWNGCGSNSRANAMIASRVTVWLPNSRTLPAGKSSQYRRGIRAVALNSGPWQWFQATQDSPQCGDESGAVRGGAQRLWHSAGRVKPVGQEITHDHARVDG